MTKCLEFYSSESLMKADLISRWNIMIGYNETSAILIDRHTIYYVINQLFERVDGIMLQKLYASDK